MKAASRPTFRIVFKQQARRFTHFFVEHVAYRMYAGVCELPGHELSVQPRRYLHDLDRAAEIYMSHDPLIGQQSWFLRFLSTTGPILGQILHICPGGGSLTTLI
jgi:hypothetical protein